VPSARSRERIAPNTTDTRRGDHSSGPPITRRLDAAYPRVIRLRASKLAHRRLGRAGPPLLFGLAPRGVFHAPDVATRAVSSYPTVSPLPARRPKLASQRFCLWPAAEARSSPAV